MFPNGLCSAGTVYDEVTPTKAIKRVEKVDLTNMHWTADGEAHHRFYTSFTQKAATGLNVQNVLYTPGNASAQNGDRLINIASYKTTKYIMFTDDRYGSSDLVDGKAPWLNGIELYYTLVEPIEISLSKNMGYAVQPGGTEQLLPENQPGATPTTIQIIIDVTYPLDSVGTLQNLKRNYMSEATLTSLITALNAINTNMSWKASRAADGSLIIAAN